MTRDGFASEKKKTRMFYFEEMEKSWEFYASNTLNDSP